MAGLFDSGSDQNQTDPDYRSMRIQTSSYGNVIPVVFGVNRITVNLLWYDDFTAVPHISANSSGKGGDSGTTSMTYTYTAAVIMALCEGPIVGILQEWSSKAVLASLDPSLTLFYGTYPQASWSYLTSKHPTFSLGYSGQAYVAASALDLGNSDSLPNLSFEVQGLCIVSGLSDANPADAISAIVENPYYGFNLSSSLVDVSDYYNYCMAADLLISPVFTSQKSAYDHIKDILDCTNSDLVWHDGAKFKVVPYGDTQITGNGVTWTPNLTPQYALTDDDFLGDSSDDPIKVTRTSPQDAYNRLQIQFCDRANSYNAGYEEYKDQAHIDIYGLRSDSARQYDHITRRTVARTIAQLIGQRQLYTRNTYEFIASSLKYGLLEPMDIVTLTESYTGMNAVPVRIVKIDEDENNKMTITAEELYVGVSHAPVYNSQTADGYDLNYNIPPGNTNTPIIFDAPGILTAAGYEVWMALSGGANWGGCDVWISSDGSTYKLAGRQYGPARYGTLSATFASGSDPDTTNTLAVDLTTSKGTLLSGSQADADNLITLCLVDDELLSYETATLTATNKYSLTYLRRGVYNSQIEVHNSGAPFIRLDNAIFKYPFDSSMLGQTVYVKLPAFNIYSSAQQLLADVSPYEFVIGTSLSYPADVENFNASQNGTFVVFMWDIVDETNINGYDIRYAPAGTTSWDDMTPLTQATRGVHLVTARVGPGSYTFSIRAIDYSGNYSINSASVTITVNNVNTIVAGGTSQASLGWPGTMTNFLVHPISNCLCPLSQGLASSDGWNTFDEFVPNPYAECTYVAQEITLAADALVRAHGEIYSYLGPGETGVAFPKLKLESRAFGGSYAGFMDWGVGELTLIACEMEAVLDTDVGVAKITDFYPTLDKPARSESGTGAAVLVTGTTFTYQQAFVNAPVPTVTPIGSSAIIAVVSAYSTTGFTVKLYNTSGTEISGTINWISTGV